MAVAVVNPTYVRRFARGMGTLAKTDYHRRCQDDCLVRLCETTQAQTTRSEAAEALSACVNRRDQLDAMRTMEKNRLGSAAAYVQSSITAHIESIDEPSSRWKLRLTI